MKKVLISYANLPALSKRAPVDERAAGRKPAYSKIEVSLIDENKQPDIANQYDYYYVPCYLLTTAKSTKAWPQRDRAPSPGPGPVIRDKWPVPVKRTSAWL
jgi:hypothetical protein